MILKRKLNHLLTLSLFFSLGAFCQTSTIPHDHSSRGKGGNLGAVTTGALTVDSIVIDNTTINNDDILSSTGGLILGTTNASDFELHYNSSLILSSSLTDGVRIRHPNASLEGVITLQNNAGTDTFKAEYDGLTGFRFYSLVHGRGIDLIGESNGGTVRSMLTGDPDSAVELYHVGTEAFSTTTGGIELNTTAPIIRFSESGATANEGLWRMTFDADQFVFSAFNDAESASENIMTVDRTIQTIDTVTFPNGTLAVTETLTADVATIATSATVAGNTIAQVQSGTIPSTTAGCVTEDTPTLQWTKIGNVATVTLTSAISCTSDATAYTIIPDGDSFSTLGIGPVTGGGQCVSAVLATDNGVSVMAGIQITNTQIVVMFGTHSTSGVSCGTNTWTASGTKGVSGFAITYQTSSTN